MSSTNAQYTYDDNGRLTSVTFPNGAMASYSYDQAGNRTTVVEIPGSGPAPGTAPVSALPKKQPNDFLNNPMVVLLSTGELIGWGDNTTGALANGIGALATNQPKQRVLFDPNTTMPPSTATIVDWAFTNANLYVVFSNGWVYSAGANTSYGQLGQGDLIARYQLKRIEYFVTTNPKSITNVWAAGGRSFAGGGGCVFFQASDYTMFGCGVNTAGNLGNGNTTNLSTPAPCLGINHTSASHVIDVKVAAAGASFSTYMLLNDGTLMVAGYNGQGQLANNTTVNVTTGFVSAQVTGGANVSNFVSISAAGGTLPAGSAIGLDSSGNAWAAGYGGYGQLGLGSTANQTRFTKITTLSNIVKAEIGGGYAGFGYALDSAGVLYTWGYNANNNLFRNNTTQVLSAGAATFVPPGITKVYFAPAEAAGGSYLQLFALTSSGMIVYSGADNGQIPITDSMTAGSKLIATPRTILDGTDTVADIFAHGGSNAIRLFVLTAAGDLYACGSNANSISTGGYSSNTLAASVEWFKIDFSEFAS